MDKFQLAEALDRYFKHLEQFGYMNIKSTSRLLLLTFLWHFLQDFQEYITEEDYNIIAKLVNCMYGNMCLLPYRAYILQSQLNPQLWFEETETRIEEDDTSEGDYNKLRQTEWEDPRSALLV